MTINYQKKTRLVDKTTYTQIMVLIRREMDSVLRRSTFKKIILGLIGKLDFAEINKNFC